MTWLLRTCFSLLLAQAVLPAARVSGTVELVDSRDPGVRKRKDYSGVVVWLEGGPATASQPKTVQMVQKNKRFTPHVLAVQVGDAVDFPNYDPIFHNAFSNFDGQPFDVGLYPPGTSQKVRFNRDGIVRIFCNIHPTMSAVIVVLKTPHHAVSSRSGAFTIEGVPPGEYTLRVFHERSPEATLKRQERRVSVGESGLDLPPIRISESGFIQTPHKNKYGKEYPPVVDDRVGYSGGRKP